VVLARPEVAAGKSENLFRKGERIKYGTASGPANLAERAAVRNLLGLEGKPAVAVILLAT
jgi:hypothetical protein